jgi:hypothetical protein
MRDFTDSAIVHRLDIFLTRLHRSPHVRFHREPEHYRGQRGYAGAGIFRAPRIDGADRGDGLANGKSSQLP